LGRRWLLLRRRLLDACGRSGEGTPQRPATEVDRQQDDQRDGPDDDVAIDVRGGCGFFRLIHDARIVARAGRVAFCSHAALNVQIE
jgi:hypothetical protein